MATKKRTLSIKDVQTPNDFVKYDVLSTEEKTALDHHENVIEKGLETFIEVGQSLQYIRDNRLYRADFNTFDEYMSERWGKSRSWASRAISGMETVKILETVAQGQQMPKDERTTRPLAKLKDNPELMAQAWIELTGKTKEEYEEGLRKSAQPTHKEVEEKVKEYEAKIKELENKQTSFLNDLTAKDETIKNQNDQIKELNSNISAKQKALDGVQTLKEELETKKANLDKEILTQANVIATKKINEEKKALDKQIKDLKAKETQIEKDLKQAESLRTTAQKQKENFDLTTNWLNSFQLTNEYLNEITGKLKQYKKELEKTPDLSQFDDEEKANLEKAIQDQVVDFNDNLHSLGGAINYLNGTVVKFNNHALRVINAEVTE